MATVAALLCAATRRLRAAGVAGARGEARSLLRHVTGWSVARLVGEPQALVPEPAEAPGQHLEVQPHPRRMTSMIRACASGSSSDASMMTPSSYDRIAIEYLPSDPALCRGP